MAYPKVQTPAEHVARYAEQVKQNFNLLKLSPNWTLACRMQWLHDLRKAIRARKQDIVDAISKDKLRNPFYAVLSEYKVMLGLCDYYIRNGARFLGGENISNSALSLLFGNKKVLVKKESYGVIGIITPSNYPFSLPMGAIIPALLAGNGVVWKPAPGTENTTGVIYELIRKTVTPYCGLANPLACVNFDRSFGQALVACKDVDKIHFTGSVVAGKWIIEENAKVRPFTPPTLELGGSNAAIVLEDADIKMAAKVIVWARFVAMSCNNVKRVYVAEPIFYELYHALKEELSSVTAGEREPLLMQEADRYKAFLADYCAHYPGLAKKYGITSEQLAPIILPVQHLPGKPLPGTNDILVLTEETFVPLLPIICVRKENGKYSFPELVNKSRFGMGVSIFTKDKRKFRELVDRFDCTTVLHNDAMTEFAMPQVPFGGRKNSGTGYVHGPEGLLEFVQLKTVIEERWSAPKLQLFPWTPAKIKWLTRLIDAIR